MNAGRTVEHLLRDHFTERESEDVATRHRQAVQELQDVRCHAGYSGRHLAGSVVVMTTRIGLDQS
jgi:hypothetical protein